MHASAIFGMVFTFAWLALIIVFLVKFFEISKNSKAQKSYMEFLCNHFAPEEFKKFKQDLERRD